MKCIKVKKLLYLFRSGELTQKQKKQLEEHFAVCENCRMERARIIEQRQLLKKLRRQPELHDPTQLTDTIMQSIQHSRILSQNSQAKNRVEYILDIFNRRFVRIVLSMSIIFLIGFFIVQETIVLHRINQLEQRVALQSPGKMKTESVLHTTQEHLNKLLLQQDNNISIDKDILVQLLNSYSELQMQNKVLLKLLEENASKLPDVTLEDGLSEQEIRQILANKKLFKKVSEL